MAVFDVLRLFDRQRTRSQIARVGIVFATLHEEAFEVFIADDRLATDDGMSLVGNGLRNAADSFHQMRDVGTDMSVATRHHLG